MGRSQIFKMSLRGILALLVVGTVCVMQYQGKVVDEPLYSIALLAVGAYFGQAINGRIKPEEPQKP